jgi:hypothetical protein
MGVGVVLCRSFTGVPADYFSIGALQRTPLKNGHRLKKEGARCSAAFS